MHTRRKCQWHRDRDAQIQTSGVWESVNESAASAASPDYVKFQGVIESAASAASPKAKSREGSSRGAPRSVVRTDTLEDTVSVKKNWHVLTRKLFLTRFDTFWHAESSYRWSFDIFLTRFETIWHFLTRFLTRFDAFWYFLTRFWHVLTRCQIFLTRDLFWRYLARVDTFQKPIVFLHVIHFVSIVCHVWTFSDTTRLG